MPAEVPDAVIGLRDVSFSYDGIRKVLSDISLDVAKGEWVAVLGDNGSGKSTLVKIMGALLIPSQGACFVRGVRTGERGAAGAVGIVFQNPESQIVGAVVDDDAAFALENLGLEPAEIERRVEWALKKVGLLHKRGSLSSALSGGEKQRLALAGALAAILPNGPDDAAACLILDEPTAMLDPEGRAEVEAVLRDIHESGIAIVHVTHRLEEVATADRVVVLARGSLMWQGSREAFWRSAESLGFQLPPLMRLKRRLVSLGAEVPSDSISDITLGASLFLKKSGVSPRTPRKGLGPLRIPLFKISNLCYSFDVATSIENRVLKDVSCVIPKGGWTSVLGRTGSGKSTLVQHLNGLYTIQAGEISIEIDGGRGSSGQDGRLVSLPKNGAELRALRRRVGLVFQSPEDQLFSATVREELAFGPKNWGFSREETDASVQRAMRDVGLGEDYLERSPLRLSGGERRLAAIASVLAADPECVVLDEPTAGLDVHYRERITGLLSRLKAAGKTIVTITHDFEMAFEHSDRLLVMDGGLKAFEGSVGGALPLLAENDSAAVPDILRVSKALRDRGFDVPLTWKAEELFELFHKKADGERI